MSFVRSRVRPLLLTSILVLALSWSAPATDCGAARVRRRVATEDHGHDDDHDSFHADEHEDQSHQDFASPASNSEAAPSPTTSEPASGLNSPDIQRQKRALRQGKMFSKLQRKSAPPTASQQRARLTRAMQGQISGIEDAAHGMARPVKALRELGKRVYAHTHKFKRGRERLENMYKLRGEGLKLLADSVDKYSAWVEDDLKHDWNSGSDADNDAARDAVAFAQQQGLQGKGITGGGDAANGEGHGVDGSKKGGALRGQNLVGAAEALQTHVGPAEQERRTELGAAEQAYAKYNSDMGNLYQRSSASNYQKFVERGGLAPLNGNTAGSGRGGAGGGANPSEKEREMVSFIPHETGDGKAIWEAGARLPPDAKGGNLRKAQGIVDNFTARLSKDTDVVQLKNWDRSIGTQGVARTGQK